MERISYEESEEAIGDAASRQRNAGRDSLMLTAAFRVEGQGEHQVRVRNLSAGGMMAEYPRIVEIGTPVQVEIRGVGWVDGRIAWCAEGRVGVAFSQAVDPIAARKPVGKGGTTPVYVKPPLLRRP